VALAAIDVASPPLISSTSPVLAPRPETLPPTVCVAGEQVTLTLETALAGIKDLEDIRALIRANRDTLNLTEVQEYFVLFDRPELLDEILLELE
jgi:hypothetical protein